MRAIGTIVDFAADGKAVVELEAETGNRLPSPKAAAWPGAAVRKRMELDVIPGIAKGTQVYVEVGHHTLLKMPALGYMMGATFTAGALAGQLVFNVIFRLARHGIVSVLFGLLVTAAAIIIVDAKEKRRAREELTPRIVGVVWKGR